MSDDELKKLLDTMIVPENRKTDWEWLRRNLPIKNMKHPDIRRAMTLIINKTVDKK